MRIKEREMYNKNAFERAMERIRRKQEEEDFQKRITNPENGYDLAAIRQMEEEYRDTDVGMLGCRSNERYRQLTHQCTAWIGEGADAEQCPRHATHVALLVKPSESWFNYTNLPWENRRFGPSRESKQSLTHNIEEKWELLEYLCDKHIEELHKRGGIFEL